MRLCRKKLPGMTYSLVSSDFAGEPVPGLHLERVLCHNFDYHRGLRRCDPAVPTRGSTWAFHPHRTVVATTKSP
eukprot:791394-Amphidinium_carterae.1